MVQEAYTYVEQTPNMDIKLKLIDTLRTVTAGKVGGLLTLAAYKLYLLIHCRVKICQSYLYKHLFKIF